MSERVAAGSDVAAVAEQAAAAVDAEALVELVRAAVGIPSVTGVEGDFADWAGEQLSAGC